MRYSASILGILCALNASAFAKTGVKTDKNTMQNKTSTSSEKSKTKKKLPLLDIKMETISVKNYTEPKSAVESIRSKIDQDKKKKKLANMEKIPQINLESAQNSQSSNIGQAYSFDARKVISNPPAPTMKESIEHRLYGDRRK